MNGIDCVFLNQDAWPKESAGQRGPGPAWPPRGRFSSKLGKISNPAKQIGAIFSSAATPGGSRRPNGSRETGQRQTSKSLFTSSLIWQVTIVYVLFSKVDNVEVGDEEVGSGEEETNSIEGAGEEEVRCIKKVMQVGRWSSWWGFDSDFLEILSRSSITLCTHAKFLNRLKRQSGRTGWDVSTGDKKIISRIEPLPSAWPSPSLSRCPPGFRRSATTRTSRTTCQHKRRSARPASRRTVTSPTSQRWDNKDSEKVLVTGKF